jgi:hypothetical protein
VPDGLKRHLGSVGHSDSRYSADSDCVVKLVIRVHDGRSGIDLATIGSARIAALN